MESGSTLVQEDCSLLQDEIERFPLAVSVGGLFRMNKEFVTTVGVDLMTC